MRGGKCNSNCYTFYLSCVSYVSGLQMSQNCHGIPSPVKTRHPDWEPVTIFTHPYSRSAHVCGVWALRLWCQLWCQTGSVHVLGVRWVRSTWASSELWWQAVGFGGPCESCEVRLSRLCSVPSGMHPPLFPGEVPWDPGNCTRQNIIRTA